MSLVERYFRGEEWVSVQEISEQTGISEDTVRRRLGELVNANRAKIRDEGGRRYYAANGRFAKTLMKQIASRELHPVKVPD
jgi:DeoR/GlpR family transcriptional regulator of sugar metabolism